MMNGAPVPTRSWSNSAISFTVPFANPVGGGQWAAGEQATVSVVVNGQTSNSVTLTVTGPPIAATPLQVRLAAQRGGGDVARCRTRIGCDSRVEAAHDVGCQRPDLVDADLDNVAGLEGERRRWYQARAR